MAFHPSYLRLSVLSVVSTALSAAMSFNSPVDHACQHAGKRFMLRQRNNSYHHASSRCQTGEQG